MRGDLRIVRSDAGCVVPSWARPMSMTDDGFTDLRRSLRSAANGLTWDSFGVKPQVSRSCLVSRPRFS